jgi:hypothetical protein
MIPAADLAQRQPVWEALSQLYLDNDIADDLPGIAATLAAAPELYDILRYEVNPVLHWNLCAPAGVWDGFDPNWLAQEIQRRSRQPRWLRALATRGALRWHWDDLAPRVQALRDQAGSGHRSC